MSVTTQPDTVIHTARTVVLHFERWSLARLFTLVIECQTHRESCVIYILRTHKP